MNPETSPEVVIVKPSRYRSINFGISHANVEHRPDGTIRMRTPVPLAQYPSRMSDRLLHWAQRAPERTFMAKRDASGQWRRISYAQALARVRSIGQAILDRGLSTERPVLILSENDLEHAMLGLACQYVGVPYAPVSPAYSLVSQDFEKLRHIVEVLTPGMVFSSNGMQYAAAVRAVVADEIEWVVTDAAPEGRQVTRFHDLAATGPGPGLEKARLATGADTIAKFLFTSGSTGLPKAVINTQRMLCSSMQMLAQVWPMLGEKPPVLVDWLPWNHTFGGNQNVGIVLYNGGTLYIDEGKPTPQGIECTLKNLRDVSPTIYFNVPAGWEYIANALKRDELLRRRFYSDLQMSFYAGAVLAGPVWESLDAISEMAVGERIVMTAGLGMTETGPGALWVVHERASPSEAGIPSPGLEIKLVPDDDKLELRYRGPNITPGYWRASEATHAAFDDEGFFRSGDSVKWLDPEDPGAGVAFDGRIAEDFKLATGTWVRVGSIRARALHEGAPLVDDVVITGSGRNELGLLIIPNLERCRAVARLPDEATPEMIYDSVVVRERFQAMLDRLASSGTGSASRPARAMVMIEPLSIDHGEVTDKRSVNQRAVLRHRAGLVQELYENPAGARVIVPNVSQEIYP